MSTAEQTQLFDQEAESELELVLNWRQKNLTEAGYPLPLAEELASSDADLHRAVELVQAGCSFETAFEILR